MALTASFTGKKVLVTGGAHGLGRYLVQRFYDDGAIVYALDKDLVGLEKLSIKLPKIRTILANLENWEETKTILEQIECMDHLVNNAAIRIDVAFLDISPDDFETIFNVNVRGIIAVSQVIAKKMIESERGGTIVNISSTGSQRTQQDGGLYSCTKSSVNMLTKSMALELASSNIRVNTVCPSFMETGIASDRMARLMKQPNSFLQSRSLIKRFIKADDVVDLVLFLLSPLSSMITGTEINIDAGTSTN